MLDAVCRIAWFLSELLTDYSSGEIALEMKNRFLKIYTNQYKCRNLSPNVLPSDTRADCLHIFLSKSIYLHYQPIDSHYLPLLLRNGLEN